jgi:ATP-dependent phosphofructokinase / diphosphate-dependent phosphofructokinase
MAAGNILIAQGGGPTAVINCSLVGVIDEAARLGKNKIKGIAGALHAIDGIINDDLVDLGKESSAVLKRIYHTPGAALGSSRRKIEPDDYGRIVEIFKRHDIRYFLYAGGNGSMHTAYRVDECARSIGYELTVVGIPKTIDNDLAYTDHCPGFGSAARYVATVTREIGIDIESLPTPVSVIETLGRNAGWLAAASSLAREHDGDAPNLIYAPERPFTIDTVLADVQNVYDKLGRVVIVVSEGLKDASGSYLGGNTNKAAQDGFGRDLPGGAAAFLASEISHRLHLRARSEKPGLAARSSIENVSAVDQKEAYLVGKAAVRTAVRGTSGVMMTLERPTGKGYRCVVGTVSLQDVAIAEKLLPDAFIASRGNDVTEAFVRYCTPLVGGPIHTFSSLRKRTFGTTKKR